MSDHPDTGIGAAVDGNGGVSVIGILLVSIGAVVFVAAVWWWALLGMTSKVGTAVSVTASCLVVAGLILSIRAWNNR